MPLSSGYGWDFWEAVLRSETFWEGCAAWVGGALATLIAILFIAFRRTTLRRFARNEAGAVAMLEFLLITPVYLVLAGLIVQFLLLAQTSLILHQAAYSAARSARVHKCPPISPGGRMENLAGELGERLFGSCKDSPEKWETAARLALIPASQSSEFASARMGGNCNYPEALLQMAVDPPIRSGLEKALKAKACYAFEPENVRVVVEWQMDFVSLFREGASGPPPIKAAVAFRYPIVTPTGMILADDKRSDGTRWRLGRAEVTLL